MRACALALLALGVLPEAHAQEDPAGSLCALPEGAPGVYDHPVFPDHGTINALVIFVQHRDDFFEACVDYTTAPATVLSTSDSLATYTNPCYGAPDTDSAESWTDDVATEWPALWSRGPDRRLPQYASDQWLAPPGSAPSAYVEGSLSQYYHLNSGGRFRLHGYVYPKVYIPENERHWYKDHPGDFPNGGVRLSHEIISYVDANPEGIDFDQRFDRYTNGTNVTVHNAGDAARDGLFDMVIMVFRSNNPCDLGVPLSASTCATRPTGLTGLGSHVYDATYDGFTEGQPTFDPLYLGSLRVIDNLVSGSGVWGWDESAGRAMHLVAHEIGHRQLYYAHTTQNSFSTMGLGGLAMLGANERVQLGWTTVHTVDVDALTIPVTPYALGDTFLDDEVLLIEEGDGQSVTLVEARTHANFWDRPPDGTNADGDRADWYPPEEGLLASLEWRQASDGQLTTSTYSLENHGLAGRPDCYNAVQSAQGGCPIAFSPGGDALTPLSNFPFAIYANPGPHDRYGLTDITPSGTGFAFDLWRDFLTSDAAPKRLQTNYTLSSKSLARTDDWTFGGSITFDDGFAAPPTATNPSITLLPGARFIVPVGVDATLRGEPGDPFPFVAGAGARVRVTGASQLGRAYYLPAFSTDHVRFQAADASGWEGLYFGSGAVGRLYDTRVEGVAWPTAQLTNAAVAAYGADLVLDDASEITGAENAHGLLAVGGTVTVTGGSLIQANEGYGVAASAGASVTVEEGTRIEANLSGGVGATGYGTDVFLSYAKVFDNEGPGVHVAAGASGSFEPVFSGDAVVEVGGNDGGLSATNGGVLNAGLCDRPGCAHVPHELIDNELGGFFDARSVGGSTLFAEGDFWGFDVDDPSDLVLVQDGSSFLSVEPIATTPGVPFTERLAGPPGRSTGSLARGAGQTAVALIAEAERRLVAGDTTLAGGLVVDALTGVAADTSATDDDRRAAFEGAGRFLAFAQPAPVVGWLGDRATEGGALRPWALRALTVAHASDGAPAEAEAAAVSLVSEDPSGEHGLAGHGHLVRIAVFAEDEAGALARLTAMAGAFPAAEATVQAASVVAAAFPEADVDGALNGAGGRLAGHASAGAASASASAAGVPASFLVSEVRPNPVGGASGRVVLDVSLPSEARVEAVLYDALGRRLGIVHAAPLGAGEHALTLSTAHLPSGVYVVYVTARLGDAPRVAFRRFTVVR